MPELLNSGNSHCVKSAHIRSFSGPCFPAFGMNTEKYDQESKFWKQLIVDRYRGFWNFLQICLIDFPNSLHENCLYSEFFWSVFSRIRTEYGNILRISPHLWVWNTHRKNDSLTRKFIKNHLMVVTSFVKHTLPLFHLETSRISFTPLPFLLGTSFF